MIMTKKIYYEKIGRRYLPVREYDSDFMDSFPEGTHMIVCHPSGKSYRYNIDPAYAPMIAAGHVCEDIISAAIVKAHESRPYQNQILTPEQLAAWNNLASVMGDRWRYIELPSAREVTEAAIKTMADEAIKLLNNPSVKTAYEHFMFIAALTKDHQNS